MIFFIIPKSKRNDFSIITVPAYGPDVLLKLRIRKDFFIVPWNEVFPVFEEMFGAVILAARQDPVCLSYAARFQAFYGVDVLVKDNPVYMKMWTMFYYWAHPMIGNLVNSPSVRPVLRAFQYTSNWIHSDALDEVSRRSVMRLLRAMPQIDRAGRDQTRICYNILELSRAFIGEVTSIQGRRLEKILALQLCLSPKLYSAQCRMLDTYRKSGRWVNVLKAVSKGGVKAMEYGRYYLPNDAAETVSGKCAELLLEAMVDSALGKKTDLAVAGIEAGLGARCTRAWDRIPPTMRCVTLMNDLRKLDDIRSEQAESSSKVSMQTTDLRLIPTPAKTEIPYCIGKAAGLSHVVKFVNTGKRDLTWSWNRDEAHDATVTYRYNLCPLWAGASGHTGGGIQFWKFVLGKAFPPEGSVVICSGLFSLWRLYYDRRISGAHTLVETLESSCVAALKNPEKDIIRMTWDGPPGKCDGADGLDWIMASCFRSEVVPLLCVDPIRVIQLLMVNLPKGFDELKEVVNIWRERVAERYWLPEWSHELSVITGTEVQSFTRRLPNTLSLEGLVKLSAEIDDVVDTPVTVTTVVITFNRDPMEFQISFGKFGEFRGMQNEPMAVEGFVFRCRTTAISAGAEMPVVISMPRATDDTGEIVVMAPVGNGTVRGGQETKLTVNL